MKLRVLTALGMALLAGALVLQYRPNPWERRITEELVHAPSNHWARPSLSAAATGHFGDVVEADWNALATLEQNWSAIAPAVRFECLQATADLDLARHFRPECQQWLAAARRHLPTIEHAVAAAEAGPPERFDPLRGQDSGHANKLQVLGRIPALEALTREAANEHDRALDACVTTLEVIRDLEWGLRSTSDELGERLGTISFYPCARALLAAGPDRRARFGQQLEAIAAGRPPLAHGFQLTRTTELLHFFGPTLPKKTLERADPKVKEWILRNDDHLNPKRLFATWDELSRHQDELVEAAQRHDPAIASPDFEAWKSVDAVFEGLKVVRALADRPAADPLPQGKQVRLTKNGEQLTLLLDLRAHPYLLEDGSVADLPNQWKLPLPQGL